MIANPSGSDALFVAKLMANLTLEDRRWLLANTSPEAIGGVMAYSKSFPEPQKFFTEFVKILKAKKDAMT